MWLSLACTMWPHVLPEPKLRYAFCGSDISSYFVLRVACLSAPPTYIWSVWPTFVFALIEHIWNPCLKRNEISTVGNPSLASVVSDRKRVLLMSVNWSCMKDTLGTYERFFWMYPLSRHFCTALSSPQALELKFDLPHISLFLVLLRHDHA
jgi:hypothetical protein